MIHTKQQRGGASLFIVIFTMLIVTIATVSFTQLMIRGQQQATTADLSQRAYNSALAGVEDAKRILVERAVECQSGTARCSALNAAIASQGCDTLSKAGISPASPYTETQVGSPSDNQAYTCVKIQDDTDTYADSIKADQSTVVPLFGAGTFDKVTITWYTRDDSTGAGGSSSNVSKPPQAPTVPNNSLSTKAAWGASSPSVLRLQYIPINGSPSSVDSAAQTAFLRPTVPGTAAVTLSPVAFPARNSSVGNTPQPVTCANSFTTASPDGVCSATFNVAAGTQKAYLQIASLYTGTHFTIKLSTNSNVAVQFSGVQPQIDSTGRAADLFRRVIARVKIGGVSLPYPDAAVYTKNNLCKNFQLDDPIGGNSYSGAVGGITCDPSLAN